MCKKTSNLFSPFTLYNVPVDLLFFGLPKSLWRYREGRFTVLLYSRMYLFVICGVLDLRRDVMTGYGVEGSVMQSPLVGSRFGADGSPSFRGTARINVHHYDGSTLEAFNFLEQLEIVGQDVIEGSDLAG